MHKDAHICTYLHIFAQNCLLHVCSMFAPVQKAPQGAFLLYLQTRTRDSSIRKSAAGCAVFFASKAASRLRVPFTDFSFDQTSQPLLSVFRFPFSHFRFNHALRVFEPRLHSQRNAKQALRFARWDELSVFTFPFSPSTTPFSPPQS